jgi:hypothetical protein
MRSKQPVLLCHRKMIGFQGYDPEGMFCVIANGDNHFLLFGITEGSLLLVDPKQLFEKDKLNVFRKDTETGQQWKLSLTDVENFTYAGRVALSVIQYD